MKKNSIHMLVKPTNGCNLRCIYCFHRQSGYENNKLSYGTFRTLMELVSCEYTDINIVWHGGEPMHVGIDAFKEYLKIEDEVIERNNVRINNSIQTNLTLINEDWLELFKKYRFDIGTSCDGITNDRSRHNTKEMISSRNLCIENGFNIGAICVVSSLNVDLMVENYNWFKDAQIPVNFNFYITSNCDDPLYVPPDQYCQQLINLFEYWVKDSLCNIRVNPFENYLNAICFGDIKLCSWGSCMNKWVCVEPNGDIYPCDKPFGKDYCYGNVDELKQFTDIYDSNGFKSLIQQSIARRNKCQKECKNYKYCNGGCNHNALVGGDISDNGNSYCIIQNKIFDYIESRVQEFLTKDEFIPNPYFSYFISSIKSGKSGMLSASSYRNPEDEDFWTGIEPGILSTVKVLLDSGYETVSSCEGHPYVPYRERCVTVRVPKERIDDLLDTIVRINELNVFKIPLLFCLLEVPQDTGARDVQILFGEYSNPSTFEKQDIFNQYISRAEQFELHSNKEKQRKYQLTEGHVNVWH